MAGQESRHANSYTTCCPIPTIPYLFCFKVSTVFKRFTRKEITIVRNHLNITIMTTLKGVIRDFLQSPHCAARCLLHVHSSDQGAIVCKSRATHLALITYNMWDMIRRDSSAITFGRLEIAFTLSVFYRLTPLTDEGWEETGVPGETPDDELQKMPHTKARKFEPHTRLEPSL